MHIHSDKTCLHRSPNGSVALCKGCRDLELFFMNVRMAFSQESFQQLNQYVSSIQLNHREQIPGCRRYCVYFRNFPLVLAFDYAEIVELRELIAEALLSLDLYDFLQAAPIDRSS